jgi:hypothetical protein
MNAPRYSIPRADRRHRAPSAYLCGLVAAVACASAARGDGKIVPPRDYKGSLAEQAQEAIIIFHGAATRGKATEDLILKIRVHGAAKSFAWVLPLPAKPTIAKEDPKLFEELFAYVQARRVRPHKAKGSKSEGLDARPAARPPVEVLSRRVVGSYDTAVVRENVAGALNQWLTREGFQTLRDAEDIIGFYRKKGYVFACIKVSDAALSKDKPVDSHPLRFTFQTGGRDGIYYPMKMTGLQDERFDVNLYIFYGAWINDRINKFGYVHRGFRLRYRDWDSRQCKPNAGKAYSAPADDPFLRGLAHRLPTVTKLFQKLHPGERYYLTNIQARSLKPGEVRDWSDDLWVFPYYVRKDFVPYDARPGGAASQRWPDAAGAGGDGPFALLAGHSRLVALIALALAGVSVLTLGIRMSRKHRRGRD